MKIKNLLIAGLIVIMSAFTFTAVLPNQALAFDAQTDCPAGSLFKTNPAKTKPADEIKTYAECNLAKDDHDLTTTAIDIINVIVAAVGIVAVLVIVIGGVFFVISTGEAAKTKRAKDTILYGVIGLVIAILAYAIVNFVLGNIFGTTS